MANDSEFVGFIHELLENFGPVSIKRMFGGHGIFRDGLMFGLIADDVLYFKVDDENRQQFEERELEKFTYYKKDKPFSMSYYQVPEEVYDAEEEMLSWATPAFEAALRKSNKSKS
jgi:DNA transformation protein